MRTAQMTKVVSFRDQDRPLGPIQLTVVGENELVEIECDQEFVIFFKNPEAAKRCIKFENGNSSRIISKPNGEGPKHVAKIQFHGACPVEGLDYSVVTANGELDPRFVPPK